MISHPVYLQIKACRYIQIYRQILYYVKKNICITTERLVSYLTQGMLSGHTRFSAHGHSLILITTKSHLKKQIEQQKKNCVLSSTCSFWSTTNQKVKRSQSKKVFGLFHSNFTQIKKCTQTETSGPDARMTFYVGSPSKWPRRLLLFCLLIPSQCTYHQWRCHSSAPRMTPLTVRVIKDVQM